MFYFKPIKIGDGTNTCFLFKEGVEVALRVTHVAQHIVHHHAVLDILAHVVYGLIDYVGWCFGFGAAELT